MLRTGVNSSAFHDTQHYALDLTRQRQGVKLQLLRELVDEINLPLQAFELPGAEREGEYGEDGD